MATVAESRPCERKCRGKCQLWLHYSRFRTYRDSRVSTNSGIYFSDVCKACEQIEHNEKKNADRPLAIIESRAATRARELGCSKSDVLIKMNWSALVPIFRAMMTPEARCLVCGHPFLNERDIQIEHHEPPRFTPDWARESARNIGIACSSCNRTKGSKSFSDWLDEQEAARLSNEEHRSTVAAVAAVVNIPAIPFLPGLEP